TLPPPVTDRDPVAPAPTPMANPPPVRLSCDRAPETTAVVVTVSVPVARLPGAAKVVANTMLPLWFSTEPFSTLRLTLLLPPRGPKPANTGEPPATKLPTVSRRELLRVMVSVAVEPAAPAMKTLQPPHGVLAASTNAPPEMVAEPLPQSTTSKRLPTP